MEGTPQDQLPRSPKASREQTGEWCHQCSPPQERILQLEGVGGGVSWVSWEEGAALIWDQSLEAHSTLALHPLEPLSIFTLKAGRFQPFGMLATGDSLDSEIDTLPEGKNPMSLFLQAL